MKTTYKSVIFDFSDTLYRFVAKDYLATLLGGDTQRAERLHNQLFLSEQWWLYDRGKVSSEDCLQIFLNLLSPEDRAAAAMYLEHWYEHYEVMPGIPEIIDKLKEKGIKIYILSNFPERFEKCYDRLELLHRFDGRLISYQTGIGKDDPEFFMMLLKKYSLVAEECIFFDDDPKNAAIARTLGIDGHEFKDAATARTILNL